MMPSPIFVRCCFHAAEMSARQGLPRSSSTADLDCVDFYGDVASLERGPQSGADEDRRDVGEQVQHDVQRRDQERDRLHRRHVARADRVDEQEPDARVVEDRLDDDDAAGEVREVQGGDLERGSEGVRDGVAPEDAPLGEPLEPAPSRRSRSRGSRRSTLA